MNISLVWFRYDLRCQDNPALFHACQRGSVLPLFIHDVNEDPVIGKASRAWLDQSLGALNQSLNGCLHVDTGNVENIILRLCQEHSIRSIFWNRCYTPYAIDRDKRIKKSLSEKGYEVITSNGSLLWEPWTIHKEDKTPYKVFTPFYRKGCLKGPAPRKPVPKPLNPQYIYPIEHYHINNHIQDNIQQSHSLRLQQWSIGEQHALSTFENFIKYGLSDYKEGRNFPSKKNISRLSPHLHFGEISPHYIWDTLSSQRTDPNVDHFLSELGWREFSYTLLFHNPTMQRNNIQKKFDHFPWKTDIDQLEKWQNGQTGIPFVDAGMRELLSTGFMHNRLRMVTGSFLVKNLGMHWIHGEQWFWQHLFDANMANNCSGWQWVAGSGADAAPYFRIFNPVTQGEKFDPEGLYTRQYVSELGHMPLHYLFNPWENPDASQGAIRNGYPQPMVNLALSRTQALESFHGLPKIP